MAWIESYQELADHPKTRRLMRQLGISLPQAVGHLHLLWWWAMDYAPDGDLAGYDAVDIAEAAHWEGDPDAFVEALVACGPTGRPGFLERDEHGLRLHDWGDYGNERTHREKAAARKRRQREREREARVGPAAPSSVDAVTTAPEPTRQEAAEGSGPSRDSHAPVTGQSRDSHATVAGPSRDGHGTVTPRSQDASPIPPSPPAPSLRIPPQTTPPPLRARAMDRESSARDPDPPVAASRVTRSPRTRARGTGRDIALEVLHESGVTIPLPDTPAGRCAAVYFQRNPISTHRDKRERNAWITRTLAVFDEAIQKGASEEALLDEIRASAPDEKPWDIADRVVAWAREPPKIGFRPFPLPEGGSHA